MEREKAHSNKDLPCDAKQVTFYVLSNLPRHS
jgi:hypothetical protein